MPDDPALDLVTAIVRAMSQPLARQPAIPAVDTADYRSALLNGGRAYFGKGEAAGAPEDGRATRAAELALQALRRSMTDPEA